MNNLGADLFRRKANLYQMEDCRICLEKFKSRDTVIELVCGHIFHEECIKPREDLFPMEDCALCRTMVVSTIWLNKGNYAARYRRYIQNMPEPEENPVEILRRHQEDDVLGREIYNGPECNQIERCVKIYYVAVIIFAGIVIGGSIIIHNT